MKRRYFYSDPLAAAWMAKHFGMRFHDADFDEPTSAPPEEIAQWGTGPIFIHPDSLHLLEPQTDDWGWDAEGQFCYSDDHRFYTNYFGEPAVLPVKIIQRNGIAFHWPEREEV